jgi:hypothetical protein
MSQKKGAIVGAIIERKPTAYSPWHATSPGKTGFPSVQHRSKSAFARNREGARRAERSKTQDAPPLVATASQPPPSQVAADDWRDQISQENEQRVSEMSEEDREEERRQIIERFGAGISSVLERARRTREKQSEGTKLPYVPQFAQPTPIQSETAIKSLQEGQIPLAQNFFNFGSPALI